MRKGPDAVRSLHSRNYKTGEICKKKGKYTKADCQKAQHNINSAVLQTTRHLKTEVQRGTKQIKDSIAQKTKDGKGRGCMDNCHIT